MHWSSFAPNTWKIGTIRTLIRRAHIVCSNQQYLEKEMTYLKHVFHEKNGYPNWVCENVKKEFESTRIKNIPEIVPETENPTNEKLLIIPYAGQEGCTIVKKN